RMHHARSSGTSLNADEVRQAQQKLKDSGDYTGEVDGKFGPKTAEAVKKFQQDNGLPQTGHLDQQTASKLGVNMTTGSGPSTSPGLGAPSPGSTPTGPGGSSPTTSGSSAPGPQSPGSGPTGGATAGGKTPTGPSTGSSTPPANGGQTNQGSS